VSAKQNKEILRKAFEKYNKGDVEALFEIIAPDHISHNTGGVEIKGRDAFREVDKLTRATLPDGKYTIDDMIAEGDKVAWRQTCRGTFTGKFRDITPTGKKVEVQANIIHRFANGKIVETWAVRDMLTMLQQMGVIPKL
jgi:steroid delta-isomerase-like uncharacterized protein